MDRNRSLLYELVIEKNIFKVATKLLIVTVVCMEHLGIVLTTIHIYNILFLRRKCFQTFLGFTLGFGCCWMLRRDVSFMLEQSE